MEKKNGLKMVRKYYVYDKLNEICSPVFGQLYHIDLLYITSYIFRICKINDMLTRNDKRSKYSLLTHLDQHKNKIIPVLSKIEAQTALMDSVYKERCFWRGQKPFPGADIKPIRLENPETQNEEEKQEIEEEKEQNKEIKQEIETTQKNPT